MNRRRRSPGRNCGWRSAHAQKMIRKDGVVQYADAGKTVSLGT